MLFSKHIINPNAVLRFSGDTAYPIGMTLEKFLFFFNHIKRMQCRASVIDTSVVSNIGASDPIQALQNLQDAVKGGSSAISASIKRNIIPNVLIGGLGDDQYSSQVSAPRFFGGDSGGFLVIDFRYTKIKAGLFFPFIELDFGSNVGSNAAGPIIGFVNFLDLGAIPVYNGRSFDDGNVHVLFASGNITLEEKYSSIRANTVRASVGTVIQFSSSEASDLQKYTHASFGSVKAASVSATSNSISVTVPANAKSGPVRFESDWPDYDTFLSYDEIIIS